MLNSPAIFFIVHEVFIAENPNKNSLKCQYILSYYDVILNSKYYLLVAVTLDQAQLILIVLFF